jgi:protein TonB
MVKRYLSAMVMATAVTFGLFFIMQLLVASGSTRLNEEGATRIIDMVRVKQDETVQRKDRKVERPPEVEAPPPDVDIPKVANLKPGQTLSITRANVNANLNIGGGLFGSITDGEYLPIVKVQPIYPRRAAERGVEGYVLLEFTVTELGTVANPVIIEEDPPGYFGRAALNAARKFKYRPKVVNGEPVPVSGVRNLITFELEDE